MGQKKRNIILVDSVPSSDLGGISQTLYNLLIGIEYFQYYSICNQTQLQEVNSSSLPSVVVRFSLSEWGFRRRPFSWFNPFLFRIKILLIEYFGHYFLEFNKLPKEGYILLSTSSLERVVLANHLAQKFGFILIPYFMDDWMMDYGNRKRRVVIHKHVKKSFSFSNKFISISRYLGEELIARYALSTKRYIVIHNPVDVNRRIQSRRSSSTLKLAYAGAIWSLHKDAIVSLIEALSKVYDSHPELKPEITFYTKPQFWQDISSLGIEGTLMRYGGYLPYADIQEHLANFDYLVVASSFKEENYYYTVSSVQTKITDYLNTGVPIISIGPNYSACNKFLIDHECGYVINNNEPSFIANELVKICSRDSQIFVSKGQVLLEKEFSKKVVQSRLFSFLESS